MPWWGGVNSPEAMNSKLTMVFTILALGPLVHAFNCRSESESIFKLGFTSNRLLVLAVIVSGSVHMVAILVPGLQPVFRANHVWEMREIWLVLAMSLLPLPLIELQKVFIRATMKKAA
jgi:Ca2+-transporting ATPase